MQSGGEALERYAEGKGWAVVRALEQDAPQVAHRRRDGATALLDDIVVDANAVGDPLVVRSGEMVYSGIVAEAADIVVLGSDVTRVADAIRMARRTLGMARQSIWTGLG